jgi:hypothetical protein
MKMTKDKSVIQVAEHMVPKMQSEGWECIKEVVPESVEPATSAQKQVESEEAGKDTAPGQNKAPAKGLKKIVDDLIVKVEDKVDEDKVQGSDKGQDKKEDLVEDKKEDR